MICLGFVNTNCTASVPQIFYTRKRKRGNKMLTLASDNLSQSEKFKELSSAGKDFYVYDQLQAFCKEIKGQRLNI